MQSEQLIILYAEDDFDEFDFFREALLRYDRTVKLYHARNGVHALESLTNYTPDFIFLDINMPLMDGWECLDSIKKTPRLADVPVFMISTTRDHASHKKSIFKGALSCFVKPYSEEEWLAVFREAFSRRSDTVKSKHES